MAKLSHAIAKAVKECNRNIPVVMGGPHASVVPKDVLEDQNIDYVVLGEGENTFLKLVESIESNSSPDTLKGIAYRKNGEVVFTEQAPLEENLDAIPMPARHLLPMHLYRSSDVRAKRHPALHMMSSRGCPYN